MTDQAYTDKLSPPASKPIRVVLDTDTFNEVDDQYALAYLLLSTQGYQIQAITAAPFFNKRSQSPQHGMELSYEEILRMLHLLHRDDLRPLVHRGSTSYLPDEQTFIPSEACDQIIQAALEASEDDPVYVIAIGAITNVSSAILKAPEIADRITVVWLGGHSLAWPDTREFNMRQDIAASRVLYSSRVPLIQIPCCGVASHLITTEYELEHWLKGQNSLCDYLLDITLQEGRLSGHACWSRVIWDVCAVAWLKGGMMKQTIQPLPLCGYDGVYSQQFTQKNCGYVRSINRDLIFDDLFQTLRRSQ